MPGTPPNSPAAGGCLFALGAIAGAVIGLFAGQPSIGLLIGVGAGAVGAFAIYWRDRR